MTVRELGERMDSQELSEWLAYAQLEPLPDPWYNAGQVCSTLVNLWSKTRSRPADWIPRVRSTRRQSPQDQLAVMQTLVAVQAAAMRHN